MKKLIETFVIFAAIYQPINSVRIIETNSFRSDSGPAFKRPETSNNRQQKLVESLAIFNSDLQSKYVDSSEIRADSKNPGPFFPIQFPPPIKYDQSNAIRYKEGENTEVELSTRLFITYLK